MYVHPLANTDYIRINVMVYIVLQGWYLPVLYTHTENLFKLLKHTDEQTHIHTHTHTHTLMHT